MTGLYYNRIDHGVSAEGLGDVPLLFGMIWRHEKPSSGIQLKVNHPDGIGMAPVLQSTYYKVLCEFLDCSSWEARLRLEGKLKGSDCFAILEVRLAKPAPYAYAVTLSPLPFGRDGRPVLPYKGEELSRFLRIVKIAFANPRTFNTSDTPTSVDLLDKLGLIKREDERTFEPNMTPRRFEEVFGVKLP